MQRETRAHLHRGPTFDLGRDDLQRLAIDLAQERRPGVDPLDQAAQRAVDDVQDRLLEIGDHQAADEAEVWLAVRAHEGVPTVITCPPLAEVSNGRANLHLHTIFSDGELPPFEVVAAHAAAGFHVVALTDHDTLAGIDALGGLEGHGLRMIFGVQLSIEDEPGRGLIDAHLPGYGFAPNNRRLRNRLHQASEAREAQKRETVERLAAAGYRVTWGGGRGRESGG